MDLSACVQRERERERDLSSCLRQNLPPCLFLGLDRVLWLLDHLGPSCGHLGAILAPSWVHLGSSWRQVGPSGAILGVFRAILGPSWAILGSRCSRKRKIVISEGMLKVLDTVLGHLGAISGPSWNQREPILSLHRAILDPGHLGAHGGH